MSSAILVAAKSAALLAVGGSLAVPPVGIGLLTTFALRWIWKTITA